MAPLARQSDLLWLQLEATSLCYFFQIPNFQQFLKKDFAASLGEEGVKVLKPAIIQNGEVFHYELKVLGSGFGKYRLLGNITTFTYRSKVGKPVTTSIVEFTKFVQAHK